jgi:hypothetical protein
MKNKFWSGTVTYYNLGENNPPYISVPAMDITDLSMVDEMQKIRKEFSAIYPGAFIINISIGDISESLKEYLVSIVRAKYLSKKFYSGTAAYIYNNKEYVYTVSWFSDENTAQTEQVVRKQLSEKLPQYNFIKVSLVDNNAFIKENFDKIIEMLEEE